MKVKKQIKYNYLKTNKYDLMNYRYVNCNRLFNSEYLSLFTLKKKYIVKKNDNLTQEDTMVLTNLKHRATLMFGDDDL